MKRMLAILGSLGLTATAGLSVVACGKSNSQFNTFMDYVNETKGSYDEHGLPKSKSSASVIVIGAKDNGSSQSFQYALEKTFDSLELAKTALNREVEVNKTPTYSFSKTISDSTLTLTESEVGNLKFAKNIKVEINHQIFDGQISKNGSEYTVIFKEAKIKESPEVEVKLTGYNFGLIFDGDPILAAWNTAYNEWMTKPNGDRSIRNIGLNLDTDSKQFGQVTSTGHKEPVYGIKGDSGTGLFSTALDYAKIKFSLKTFMVDKVSDYWNSDLFKSIANDYLKKDLMYQLTADLQPEKDDVGYKKRQTAVDAYLGKIKEAKGPLFFIVKNGHVIKIMKGWTRYEKFGNQKSEENADTFSKDLMNWISEVTGIMNKSFFDNNAEFFDDNGNAPSVKTWKFADGENKDDGGASNWDPKKEEPTS